MTEKIKQAPLDLLCLRCKDILQWRIDYRKYKTLTIPGKCNCCLEKVIVKAYRTLCDPCAKKNKQCSKCAVQTDGHYADIVYTREQKKQQQIQLEHDTQETLQGLKERCKRTVLRKIELGEVAFDKHKKIFYYVETEEEYKI